MPQFRYRAVNSQGHELEGTMSAADANAAVVQLSRQGLRLRSIEEGVSVVQPVFQSAPPAVAQRPVLINPVSPRVQPVHQVSHRAKFGAKPSRRSTYGDRQFFFAQLGSLLKTGISPADSLHTILSRSSNSKFQEPVDDMAKMTAEGMSLADAMEHYPNMFPRGVIGAVRAGEHGGYLPDACETVSNQQKETRKIFWFFVGLLIAAPFMAFIIFLSLGVAFGLNKSIDALRDDVTESVFAPGVVQFLTGPTGFVFLFAVAAGLFAYFVGRALAFRPLRHRIGLAMPPLRWRAYNENLSHFGYHLGQLAKSGHSPLTSWNLAAQAVPNEAYAKRLLAIGSNMSERAKLSELLYRSKLFPHETARIVETGEVTGDLPKALDQVMDLGREREKQATIYIALKAGCWTAMLLFLPPIIAVMIIYLTYIRGVFRIAE